MKSYCLMINFQNNTEDSMKYDLTQKGQASSVAGKWLFWKQILYQFEPYKCSTRGK